MGDTDRLQAIEDTLKTQGKKLDQIGVTLNQVAVQKEQIDAMKKNISSLWDKYDEVFGPDGILVEMQKFQASCPRKNLKLVWIILLPTAFMQLAMGVAVLGLLLRGG